MSLDAGGSAVSVIDRRTIERQLHLERQAPLACCLQVRRWVEVHHHIPFVFIAGVMSLVYESCLLSMSHVSYLRVMSLVYESCLLSTSHVSCLPVMSLVYESCLLSMSHVPCLPVMSLV